MEPSAAPLDTTPDPAIVQPPGASPPVPPREQQQQQEQLRIGDSGQFSEGLEDREYVGIADLGWFEMFSFGWIMKLPQMNSDISLGNFERD
ncbi:hypothetical protein WISP_126738 [Willisornis vidua]|uniref:Uncharacterized protein n=1 Tax=Willisornis vidua TaxID=1566151 RepID=A0ABQ9CTS8_9PASS|nr:hypothetical protein WISP_126738 [Willisornis vidua]